LHDGVARTDGQLLDSFIDHKDEAAFAALVRRHGSMVLSVCSRVVRNHHDAEDAFQATFLILARKASSVNPREMVANWLHGVAFRTALKARAMTAKRHVREKQVTEMPETEVTQQDPWHDLQPLIDQELSSLPENYRLPIILCDLEGKTIKEATQQLGWPQGTLAGRLARGRKILAKRLVNRGVVLSAGSLAAVVSQNVVSAGVPTLLMSSTVKAAAMIAAEQATVAGVVPAKVAILMEGVLKGMMLTKLKTVTVLLLVIGALGVAGGFVSFWTPAAAQTVDKTLSQVSQEEPGDRPPSNVTGEKKPLPQPAPMVTAQQVPPSDATLSNGADKNKPVSQPPLTPAPRDRRFEARFNVVEVGDGGKKLSDDVALMAAYGQSVDWRLRVAGREGEADLVGNELVDSALLDWELATSAIVTELPGGKLRLDWRVETSEQKKAAKEEVLFKGTSLRIVKIITPGEKVSLELDSHDMNRRGTRWELTVRQIEGFQPIYAPAPAKKD
jgi:RNA polymerase sigma factor (sigma-70 family)